jgi:2-polyprenyl-6-methoxyphenol hydroxylase-like FAD-dependent oxidoreductase
MTVLIVGAGPTGLALATQLRSFGTRFRIIDRQADRVHESRALAVQPRTLEVLTGLGIADTMVERGNRAVRLQMHADARRTEAPLFDMGLDDTAYPFLLFLSQAETEAILDQHLAQRDVTIERGVELTGLEQSPGHVTCTLRHPDGSTETIDTDHVVGCDGVHSTVRTRAGITFAGSAYPQTFVLADLDAEGLDAGAVHVHLSPAGMLFFFPLAQPAPWRLLGMQPDTGLGNGPGDQHPDLADLQDLADAYTAGRVRLRDPVWTTFFRLHHRHAISYRSGRVFLAGDAAHVHSPAGAQGMNTGIQDAWNLGWKLALVSNGTANGALLDTYQTERQPVGRSVVRFTDRAFTIATSIKPLIALLRTHVAPRLIHVALGFKRGRALGFRTISQLAINYRDSPAAQEGQPKLRRGPRAGDRLPDAPIVIDGQPQTLHRALATPRFHLLLAGATATWPTDDTTVLGDRHARLVDVHRLTRGTHAGALVDVDGHAHTRLGLDRTNQAAHYLVRPDGHIAYRAATTDLGGMRIYLDRWLSGDLATSGNPGPSA